MNLHIKKESTTKQSVLGSIPEKKKVIGEFRE